MKSRKGVWHLSVNGGWHLSLAFCSSRCRRGLVDVGAEDHDRQQAALSRATGAAFAHPCVRAQVEVVQHARDRRRVETTEGKTRRFTDLAEEGSAQIDRCRSAPQFHDRARSRICLGNEGTGGSHRGARTPCSRKCTNEPALER